jgi:hypothetical protein
MKTTISLYDFRREFEQCRPNNFSYEALGLLFAYFEELEEGMGEEIELDVIAICCEYSENTFEQIAANYEVDLTGVDEADIPQAIMDFLCDNTTVVGETSSGFVYAIF